VATEEGLSILYSAKTLDECERGVLELCARLLVEKGGLSMNEAAFVLSCLGNLAVCQVINPLKTMRVDLPAATVRELGMDLR
jgi:amidase